MDLCSTGSNCQISSHTCGASSSSISATTDSVLATHVRRMWRPVGIEPPFLISDSLKLFRPTKVTLQYSCHAERSEASLTLHLEKHARREPVFRGANCA